MTFQFSRTAEHADVFADILGELAYKQENGKDDLRHPKIDTVDFLERITPIFESFRETITPRHFKLQLPNARKGVENDYFVFARGMPLQPHRQSTPKYTMGYRIISISAQGQLDILDIDRMMDEGEIFSMRRSAGPDALNRARKKLLETGGSEIESHLRGMLSRKRLNSIASTLSGSHEARWVHKYAFMTNGDLDAFKSMTATHVFFAGAMIDALEPLIGDHRQLRDYLHGKIQSALKNFNDQSDAQDLAVLATARDKMDPHVLGLLAVNPSARTASNYNWALDPTAVPVFNDQGKPVVAAARQKLLKDFPIIALIEGYQKDPEIRKLYQYVDQQEITDHFFNTRARHYPPMTAKDKKDLEDRRIFFRNLREDAVGADNAHYIQSASAYLASFPEYVQRLKKPADWALLQQVINASTGTAAFLGRPVMDVFADIARGDKPYNAGDIITRHFNVGSSKQARINDMYLLSQRLNRWVVTPKLITEGRIEKIQIPVRHAFYMAARGDLLGPDTVRTIDKKLRNAADGANHGHSLLNILQDDVRVTRLLDKAFDFATSFSEDEAAYRQVVLTNRLADRAADYPFPALPAIELEMGYTMMPIRSQAELMKICTPTRNPLVFEGVDAINQNTYFVSLRNKNRDVLAVGKINGPDKTRFDWAIEKIEEMSRKSSNRDYRYLFEDYLRSPHFHANITALQNERVVMTSRMMSTASDLELLGLDPDNIEEKTQKIKQMSRYIGVAKYEVDELGTLSTPDFDRAVRNVIQAVKPYYRIRPDLAL